jgi:surface antigen
MKRSIAAALSGALLLSGCANMPPPNMNKPATMGEVVGAVAGGVGAGLAMYYMGPGAGWGRVVLAALGAGAGAAVGYQAGSMLSQMDMRRAESAANQAFAEAQNGQAIGWNNPETGNSGVFLPTNTYVMNDGTLCRDFKTSVATKDTSGQTQGTACRMSDGSWAAAGLAG